MHQPAFGPSHMRHALWRESGVRTRLHPVEDGVVYGMVRPPTFEGGCEDGGTPTSV